MSTPSAPPPGAQAALAALRERYRSNIGTTVAAFERLSEQLATTPDAPEVVEALRRELHRVVGTAGTYGFHDASRLARTLEERAIRWAQDPSLDRGDRAPITAHFARALHVAVTGSTETEAAAAGRRLLLVAIAGEAGDALAAEATLRGFTVERLEDGPCDSEHLIAREPDAVVVPLAALDRLPADFGVPVLALAEGQALRRRATRAMGGPRHVTVADLAEEPAILLDLVEDVAARAALAGATLVVVDDDPSILVIVRHLAEALGLEVITLTGPAELARTVRDHDPALVLMDINMGDASGIEATRALREAPAFRSVPVVLFSSAVESATRQAAFEAGADEFMAKPLVPEEVRQRLRRHLERRRLQRLAEGLHPALGIAIGPRTVRDASIAWARLATPSAVALRVHLPGGIASGAAVAECRRVLRAVEPAFAGIDDIGHLALVVEATPEEAVRTLRGVAGAAPEGAPLWRAGVATGEDAAQARARAIEALDTATQRDLRAHAWRADDAPEAPEVFVVEDDVALSDMLQYALRATGFTFRAYDNGPDALAALLAARPAPRPPVVLLDIELPGMDGHTLHERLRVERPGGYAVVFVSGHASESEQLRALRAGAIDFLAKPINLRVLMAKIPNWLHRARGAA